MRELCGLPRAQVLSMIVVLARNLDLRNFVYKVRGRRVLAWLGQREGPVWMHQASKADADFTASACPQASWAPPLGGGCGVKGCSGDFLGHWCRTFTAALVAGSVLTGEGPVSRVTTRA